MDDVQAVTATASEASAARSAARRRRGALAEEREGGIVMEVVRGKERRRPEGARRAGSARESGPAPLGIITTDDVARLRTARRDSSMRLSISALGSKP